MSRKSIAISSLLQRINRRLRYLNPERSLRWEWKGTGGAYWLYGDNTYTLGPYYWCYLIGLARHIGCLKTFERRLRLFIRTPTKDIEEELIPDKLLFPVVYNHKLPKLRRYKAGSAGMPPASTGVTDAVTEDDEIPPDFELPPDPLTSPLLLQRATPSPGPEIRRGMVAAAPAAPFGNAQDEEPQHATANHQELPSTPHAPGED